MATKTYWREINIADLDGATDLFQIQVNQDYAGWVNVTTKSGVGNITVNTSFDDTEDRTIQTRVLDADSNVSNTLTKSIAASVASPATIISPAANATFSGDTVTVTWALNGDTDATGWSIGATSTNVGAPQHYYDSSIAGNATSHTLTNMTYTGEMALELRKIGGTAAGLRDTVVITTGVVSTPATLTPVTATGNLTEGNDITVSYDLGTERETGDTWTLQGIAYYNGTPQSGVFYDQPTLANDSGSVTFDTSSVASGIEIWVTLFREDAATNLTTESSTLVYNLVAATLPQLTTPADTSTFTDTFTTFGWTTTNNQGYTHFRTVATWSGGSSTGSITTGSGQNLISLPDGGESITVQLQVSAQDDPGFEAIVVDTHTYTAYTAPLVPVSITYPTDSITIASATLTMTWVDPPDIQPADRIRLELHDAGNVYQQVHSTITPGTQTLTWSGIPTDGRALILDIGVLKGGTNPVVQAAQINFTASSAAAATKALLTSPTSGQTLTSGSHTFQWSASTFTDVDHYAINVMDPNAGYATIDANWNIPFGTNQITLTGLSTDGRAMHVKLYEYSVGGTELRSDEFAITAYTSSGATGASFVSPTAGGTLAGAASDITVLDNSNSALYGVIRVYDNTTQALLVTSPTWAETAAQHTFSLTGLPTDGRSLRLEYWEDQSGDNNLDTKVAEIVVNAYNASGGGALTAQTTQITATASQVIEDLCFDGFGNNDLCIYIPATASNVTIRNCSFKNCVAVIKSDNAANLTIEECLFHDVGKGIYLLGCSNPIVRKNTFTRFGVYDVRNHADSMGWSGNAIQFNTCTTDNSAVNCDQNIIDANYSTATVTDLSGHGWWVDAISAFACSGTSFTNMFKMNGNIIRGIKSNGTQAAGGMIAGDSGGNYVEMDGNKILNYGQYGIGLAPITNSKVTNNLSYLEQGHGFDVGDGSGTFKLIQHPSDGANANGGFGFVFSGFGGGSCSNNDIHGNDFMGFTQWGWKPTAEDSVNASGGTTNVALPTWDHGGGNAGTCTDTDYSGNNVSSSLASHPNLTAMAAEDPYTTVATAANGYFDRTQTCS